VRPFRHAEFEADRTAGGYAFVDDTQLFVACRNGSWGIGLLDAEEPPKKRLDEWLARNRHTARDLTWDELGPWQRAAVTAVRADVTVAELPAADRAGIETELDRDHADWIWIDLHHFRTRQDPLRTLAGDDSLMAPPTPPDRSGRRTHPCPLCGRPAQHMDRYPRSLCAQCHGRTVDSTGRPIQGVNTSMSGGFEAQYVVPDGVCDEVTSTGRCWVDGHECSIGEARFGGVVVQAR
jgi:hypothetical protein